MADYLPDYKVWGCTSNTHLDGEKPTTVSMQIISESISKFKVN